MSTKALNQCQWEYREKGCIHEYVNWRVTFVKFYTKRSRMELCIRMCFQKRYFVHNGKTLTLDIECITCSIPQPYPPISLLHNSFSVALLPIMVMPTWGIPCLTLSLAIHFPTSPTVCFPEHFQWCVLAVGGWWLESLDVLMRLSCFD